MTLIWNLDLNDEHKFLVWIILLFLKNEIHKKRLQDCHFTLTLSLRSLCVTVFSFHSYTFDSSWFQRQFILRVKCLKFLLHHKKNSWIENYKLISFCIKIGFRKSMNVYVESSNDKLNDIKKLGHFLQSSMTLTPCLDASLSTLIITAPPRASPATMSPDFPSACNHCATCVAHSYHISTVRFQSIIVAWYPSDLNHHTIFFYVFHSFQV